MIASFLTRLSERSDSMVKTGSCLTQSYNIISFFPTIVESYVFTSFRRIIMHWFTSKSSANPILKVEDVTFKFVGSAVPHAFELQISGYKHSQDRTTTLYIAQNPNRNMCPVLAIWNYFNLRGSFKGPIFSIMDGIAVSEQLVLSLQWAGCITKLYKSHSFRIGRATVAAAQGMSDDTITQLDRWSSSAVKNYIRLPVVHS